MSTWLEAGTQVGEMNRFTGITMQQVMICVIADHSNKRCGGFQEANVHYVNNNTTYGKLEVHEESVITD